MLRLCSYNFKFMVEEFTVLEHDNLIRTAYKEIVWIMVTVCEEWLYTVSLLYFLFNWLTITGTALRITGTIVFDISINIIFKIIECVIYFTPSMNPTSKDKLWFWSLNNYFLFFF